MEVGFDTIGNATLIVYDRGPLLAADPWIMGPAYFGSWSLSHEIPPEQLEAVGQAPYVWFSHGHPDHLNGESLNLFRNRRILLPDHVGGRIARTLRSAGYDIHVLPDGKWMSLSPRVRIRCTADANQDASLLVDINGRLVVNMNDTGPIASPPIRKVVAQFPKSILLRYSGFGGIYNFHDEVGNRVPPPSMVNKTNGYLVGASLAKVTEAFGATHVIPFSSMQRYQRADSFWANEARPELTDYPQGFVSKRCQFIPAYVRYDCATDQWEEISPEPVADVVLDPVEFGDNWSDELDAGDVEIATQYFRAIQHVDRYLNFVNLRVGGRDNVIPLGHRGFDRGVTFECPRNSLMCGLTRQIFDDLLIGNFMKATLHGSWPSSGLFPHFTPYVAKYADNGEARTNEELKAYFSEYRRRMAPLAYVRHQLERQAAGVFRSQVSQESPAYRVAERAFWTARSFGRRRRSGRD
jgi:hypothetical protein